uniref:G6b-B extracellular V-set Ig-like domain-containing protein n=1 Tax=Terrapene triunguis TaxID=2587831 RepID=A0A674K4R2_9SAUR
MATPLLISKEGLLGSQGDPSMNVPHPRASCISTLIWQWIPRYPVCAGVSGGIKTIYTESTSPTPTSPGAYSAPVSLSQSMRPPLGRGSWVPAAQNSDAPGLGWGAKGEPGCHGGGRLGALSLD